MSKIPPLFFTTTNIRLQDKSHQLTKEANLKFNKITLQKISLDIAICLFLEQRVIDIKR